MKAVVMAGGEGTRLRPLTSNQPKPMVPIVGKPCIEHIVELLRGHGFEDVVITLAFLPQAIRSYFGDGETLGAEHRVLGRGAAARNGRLGPAREREARRDVPRHLRRRALRRRPRLARRQARGEGRRRHDRAQVGRQPARVRDRRHRRGRQGRALPREAVVGPGLLGHDQHRHLRARAGGADAHPGRRAVRLLEGALPAAARDGQADLRARARRLLAGHRQPRPVPAGELRRARREGAPEHRAACGCAATSGSARAPTSTTPRRSRARRSSATTAGSRATRRSARTRCSRTASRCASAPAPSRTVIDSSTHVGRSALIEGAIVGPLLRHPRPRPHPGGRGDRRRGDDRLRVEHHAARPDLPLQGGRDRLPALREPDLGDARVVAAVRQGRRHRASSTST